MEINLFPNWMLTDNEAIQGSVSVIIDVLRATSTIVAGMENGASSIIPVEDIETASRLVGQSDRGAKLLAGEWKGMPIDGFDIFNSPNDFTRDKIGGKTVIFTTTNGTRAIVSAAKAERVIICSLNNLSAVGNAVEKTEKLNVICAGNSGRLSSEDLLCAGLLLERVCETAGTDCSSDAGMIALLLAREYSGRIEEFIRATDRGRQLIALGYESDIVYCSDLDSSGIVPEIINGRVVI